MTWKHYLLCGVFLVSAFALGLLTYRTLFGGEILVKPVLDRDYCDAAKSLVSSAKDRIYLAVYYLNPRARCVRDILADMNRVRDVKVVYYDGEGVPWGKKYPKMSRGLMHAKVLVADNCVLLGSTNWSSNGFFYSKEADILVCDPETADVYVNYILNLWNEAS